MTSLKLQNEAKCNINMYMKLPIMHPAGRKNLHTHSAMVREQSI